jgi:Carboxypeptidase regulatory-like domain
MCRKFGLFVGLIVTLLNQTGGQALQEPGFPSRDVAHPKPGTATIRGRVVAADSGQPLRKAQVRLGSIDMGRAPGRFENQLSTTDAEGRYEFGKLPAGRYRLSVIKGGYVTLEYGQRRFGDSGKPIELVDEQLVEKIDFALPRGAVITGRVIDENGEPTVNVFVAPMRYRFDERGRRRLSPTAGASTNDLGEFRIFALPPGEYYVSATFPADFGESNDRVAYAPIYYPATPDVDLADRITVASGQTVSDLLLTLSPVRTVRVSGTAVDADGRPMPGFLSVQSSRSKVADMNQRNSMVQPDGSFVVGGLTPGEYRIVLHAVPLLGSSEPNIATAVVTVGSDDLTGIRLVAAKASVVAGKLVFADGPAPQSLRPSAFRIIAMPDDDTGGQLSQEPPAVNDDWTFRLTLPAGRTRLFVSGGSGWDTKAVRSGDVDVTDVGLDVKPGEDISNLEIELTSRVTETNGLVTDERGETVKDYAVVIFPRDAQKRGSFSRSVRTARSDQEGRFKVGGLPPGQYFAYAADFIEPGQEHDPEFLDGLQTLATPFTLGEGATYTLNLTLHKTP